MIENAMIIGDLHLKATCPVSRKDDYPFAILNKLLFLSSIANGYNCRHFILLGDVFDSPLTSLTYLSQVIDTFKRIKESGITIYTIVGNHDIKNNRIESLNSTALGILIATGYVKKAPRKLEIGNTIFNCFDYPDELSKRESDDKYSVCVAHRYYKFNLDPESLDEEDLVRLNYDAMVLGHYHVPCDNIVVNNTILYRPGSLSRSTSEPYNKVRVPRVLLFNTCNHKSMYIDVPCGSSQDVFVEKVESNGQLTLSMKDLINFMTTSYSSTDLDVREYFNTLEIPFECRNKISKYLDCIGV